EGFAFFTEAIFLGIYLYGWNRVPPKLHCLAGGLTAVSGALSAFFVVLANAWMNAPSGFRLFEGQPVDVDPLRAMFSPGWHAHVVHVLLASYIATAAVVVALHAWALLRDPTSRFHLSALQLGLVMLVPTTLLQLVSGDLNAQQTARLQ